MNEHIYGFIVGLFFMFIVMIKVNENNFVSVDILNICSEGNISIERCIEIYKGDKE